MQKKKRRSKIKKYVKKKETEFILETTRDPALQKNLSHLVTNLITTIRMKMRIKIYCQQIQISRVAYQLSIQYDGD